MKGCRNTGVWDFTVPSQFVYLKHCEDNYIKKGGNKCHNVWIRNPHKNFTKAFFFVSGATTLTKSDSCEGCVFRWLHTNTHTHTQKNHSHLQGTSDYIHTMWWCDNILEIKKKKLYIASGGIIALKRGTTNNPEPPQNSTNVLNIHDKVNPAWTEKSASIKQPDSRLHNKLIPMYFMVLETTWGGGVKV